MPRRPGSDRHPEYMTDVAPGTFLASLNSDERDALHGLGVRRTFPRSTVLMFQNEPDARVMLLLAGRVKVTRVDHDGHEMLLSIRDPGDVLGELALDRRSAPRRHGDRARAR